MSDQLPPIVPDSDDEGLSSLSDLAAEVIGHDRLDFEPTDTQHRLKNTTPPAERYPPVFDRYSDQQAPADEPVQPEPVRQPSVWGYNLLSLFFLIGTVGLIVYFVHLWNDPFSALNPLSPPTPYVQITVTPFSIVAEATPTATESATFTPEPSTTPTATNQPTESFLFIPTQTAINQTAPTHLPTQTPEPTATLGLDDLTPDAPALEPSNTAASDTALTHTPEPSPTPEPETATPAPTETPHPDHRFQLTEAGVIYRQNQNNLACNWQSITGTITNQRGNPLNNYRVRIIDAQDPMRFDVSVTTGAFINLGDGVYEQLLGNTPRERDYRVQVYDAIGLAVSAPITLQTRGHCMENVTVVDFVQFR